MANQYFQNGNDIQNLWETTGVPKTSIDKYFNNGVGWDTIYRSSSGCTSATEGTLFLTNGGQVRGLIAQDGTCGVGVGVVGVGVGVVGVILP